MFSFYCVIIIVFIYFSNVVRAPSEAGSQTSSLDSKLLNARKPDPEEILLGLGFGGGIESTVYGEYGRVPNRFLQPSQLKGVSVEDYLKHQQELIYMYESGLWGYRGLTGWLLLVFFYLYSLTILFIVENIYIYIYI